MSEQFNSHRRFKLSAPKGVWVQGIATALILSVSVSGCAGDKKDISSSNAGKDTTLGTKESVGEKDVSKNSETKKAEDTGDQSREKTAEKRKEIISEAVSTLRETQNALKSLDEGKNAEALSAIEKATGKLEIILAREPELALAPIDVKVSRLNLYASIDEVKKAKKEAERLLKDGRVQDARGILRDLGYETVISTSSLPLAGYPEALKKAASLIDDGKPDKAKEVLQTALNTLVVTDYVIPIPVVKAKVSLEEAEKLAKKESRSGDENTKLSSLLNEADKTITFAEELGYGKRKDFADFHKEISEIRKKTSEGKSGDGFFEKIKGYIGSMTKDSQHKDQPSK